MDWTWYLFRFDGRIGRAKFWLAGLIILCWMIFMAAIVVAFGAGSFAFSISDIFKVFDPDTYRALSRADLPLILTKLIGTPLFTWVFAAAFVKRLHDRGKSAWWLLAYFVMPGLFKQFEGRLPDSYWIAPIALACFVLLLAGFVETGFLRGTRGPNRFGPDPLAENDSSPAPPARRWDQHRELEIVPPHASPPRGMHVKRGA